MTVSNVRPAVIDGRELFVCDGLIEPAAIAHIGQVVKALHYVRREKSRPGVPGLAAVADIPLNRVPDDPFLKVLRSIAEQVFPSERFTDQRAYVNSSVFGDGYYAHRDCGPTDKHVTALYYANTEWHADWGGETIYFNDAEDAQLVVSPKPGRVVIARGAILHRGGVPARICHEERYTLAYKLNYAGPR